MACVFIDRKDFERNIFDSVLVHHYLHLKTTVNVVIFKGISCDQSAPVRLTTCIGVVISCTD